MSRKGVIIQGSSRSEGNTYKIVSYISDRTKFEIIDLHSKKIGFYDYDSGNINDDFIPLMKHIVNNYDILIFATPVYWYAMSGIMKTFFDRLTDCLKIEKEVGRKLRGKTMGMVSCGSDADLKHGFKMPFIESATYLGMKYLGDIHTWLESGLITEPLQKELDAFSEKIKL